MEASRKQSGGGGGGLVSSKDPSMPNLEAKKECGKVNKMIMDTEFNWAFIVEGSECLFKLMSPTACNTHFVIRRLLISIVSLRIGSLSDRLNKLGNNLTSHTNPAGTIVRSASTL